MAMSKCRECGKAVSTLAKTCPHCGVPKPVKKIAKKIKKKKKSRVNIQNNIVYCSNCGTELPSGPPCDNPNCRLSKKPKIKIHKKSEVKKSKTKDIVPDVNNYVQNNEKIWVHCRNYKCRDYTQMYEIYEDYLNLEKCSFCQSKFIEAKLANGKPVMPSDGIYDKLKDKNSEFGTTTSATTSKNTSAEKGVYDRFVDGNLDLATAFWLFGIVGSFIGSLILTLLAELVSKIFYIAFVGLNVFIIASLWECAENYKKEKLQKKQSPVWGYLTQVFCVVGALGLISTIVDIFKTL